MAKQKNSAIILAFINLKKYVLLNSTMLEIMQLILLKENCVFILQASWFTFQATECNANGIVYPSAISQQLPLIVPAGQTASCLASCDT